MDSTVFHIRLKQFEIQVERLVDATLRNRPLAVISSHHQNGTLISVSPEAATEGLRPGLKVALARKMAPRVKLLPYNNALYARVHRYLYHILSDFSPIIEPTVFGQYYLDMTGMTHIFKNTIQAAHQMSRTIDSRLRLGSLIGISVNKLVSHICTAVVPETIHQVSTGWESHFLAPLQSGILPVSQEKEVACILRFLFLQQIKELQQMVAQSQVSKILFGRHHKQVSRQAQGRDNSAVRPPQLRDHLVRQTILRADTNDIDILQATVGDLAEQLAYQLRQRRQIAKSLILEVHYTDGFKNCRRSRVPANDDCTVKQICHQLFEKANYRRNRIRSILLDATQFQSAAQQLSLFAPPRNDNLSAALDHIRNRYGFASIRSASALRIPAVNSSRTTAAFRARYQRGYS